MPYSLHGRVLEVKSTLTNQTRLILDTTHKEIGMTQIDYMEAVLANEPAMHELADRLCRSMRIFAYVICASTGTSSEVFTFGGWAGEKPDDVKSSAPQVAHGKLGEMILMGGGSDGKLIMSPIEHITKYGWMGAVAQDGYMVAVSKLAEEHDRLVALMVLYSQAHYDIALHHVGFRFESEADYLQANASKDQGMQRDIPGDHMRTYFEEDDYYTEHQWFQDGPHTYARHWDIVTDDPRHFLTWIAAAFGTEPTFFEHVRENDPVGVVWIESKDGTKFGVMARSQFWYVEED